MVAACSTTNNPEETFSGAVVKIVYNGQEVTNPANGTKSDVLYCAATNTLYVNSGTYSSSYVCDKYRGVLVDPNNLLEN